jgi:UDP-GlcNAc:undecaprenyl-phosphate GlcNAc-1-phosphate transferase
MAIIPMMIRLAPRIGMVDQPDPRKVHAVPIPRVGGLGIIVGALAAMILWMPFEQAVVAYLFGSVVLLVFGAWDDSCELGHYVKFIGQFIAVIALVYWGDVWVSMVPFLAEPLPAYIGKPFTVFAVIGVINAINHSDGLDGLAAGESMMSMGAMAYLAYLADGQAALMIALATMGGVFGFLRFNTHPARVFMGDAGSQFLGFSLAVITIRLTQHANPGLSMALPALLLGLPVIDILAVFAQRAYHRLNWFKATKNHIHHRLLELGFDHYQSVVIIYSIQAFFVASALVLRYESDSLIVALYLGVCASLFSLLFLAERKGWQVNRQGQKSKLALLISRMKSSPMMAKWPVLFIKISIPIYLVAGSFMVGGSVPRDFGIAAVVLAVVLAFGLVFYRMRSSEYLVRVAVYATAAFVVYLLEKFTVQLSSDIRIAELIFYVLLGGSVAFVIRYVRDVNFHTTPTDYLLVFLVVVSGILSRGQVQEDSLGILVVKVVILFYGAEIIISRGSRLWNAMLDFSVLAATGILGAKVLLSG